MPKKILIIDDEPKIVEICRDYLKAAFFDTVTANDGPSALAAVDRENPDLIILDLMLPGMDGLDVCREVRREHNTPIIMLTAINQVTNSRFSLNEGQSFLPGVNDFMTKPVKIDELLEKVKKQI